MREMSTSYTKSIKPEQIKTILTKERKNGNQLADKFWPHLFVVLTNTLSRHTFSFTRPLMNTIRTGIKNRPAVGSHWSRAPPRTFGRCRPPQAAGAPLWGCSSTWTSSSTCQSAIPNRQRCNSQKDRLKSNNLTIIVEYVSQRSYVNPHTLVRFRFRFLKWSIIFIKSYKIG